MSMGEKTAFVKQGRAEENKFSWPQCFSQIYLTSTAQHLWTPSFPPLQLAPNMPGYFVLFGPMRQTRCTLDINTSTCIMHVKSSVTENYIGCGQTVQGLWDPAEQMWCSSCRTQWLNQGSVWYFFLYTHGDIQHPVFLKVRWTEHWREFSHFFNPVPQHCHDHTQMLFNTCCDFFLYRLLFSHSHNPVLSK